MKEVKELKGKIKHIIFDFGGVLLELYPERSYAALSNTLGIYLDIEALSLNQIRIFDEYEMGLMRDETFLWNIQSWSIQKPQPRAIIDAWNAMLGGWKPEKIELLKKASTYFNTFLLSNTNAIHMDWVRRDLLKNHGVSNFEDMFFNKVYLSHIVKMRKPNLNIFEYVINDANIDPSKTLFIDDNLDNVQAARTTGLHAILHKRNAPLDYIFDLV